MNAAAAPDLFARPAAEGWLVQRLEQLGYAVEPNPATPLRDRIRAAITGAGIGCLIVGRRPDGKGAEDFESAFERIFGEPLIPKAPRGTRSRSRSTTQPR